MPTKHVAVFALNVEDLVTVTAKEEVNRYLQEVHGIVAVEPSEADLIISIGGDGTTLAAAKLVAARQGSVLALHTGTKGFLATEHDPDQFLRAVDAALQNDLNTVPIPILDIEFKTSEGEIVHFEAVNDMTIECAMTWLTMNIARSDGSFSKQVRGAGIALCTPIGSTTPLAAHVQCPVLDPHLRALYMKVINDAAMERCGTMLHENASTSIRLDRVEINRGIPEAYRYPPGLFVDGARVASVQVGDELSLRYTDVCAHLLRA